MSQGYYFVYVTTAGIEEAQAISTRVVEKRLAACANIVPKVESIYWWNGKLHHDQEALIFLKTTAEKADELMEEIRALSSYEVPDISFIELARGNPDFLNWIDQEVAGG